MLRANNNEQLAMNNLETRPESNQLFCPTLTS